MIRQCATNQYLRKRDDPRRYCQGPCANVTKCGPVVVPEQHLQVGPPQIFWPKIFFYYNIIAAYKAYRLVQTLFLFW